MSMPFTIFLQLSSNSSEQVASSIILNFIANCLLRYIDESIINLLQMTSLKVSLVGKKYRN